MSAHTEGPWDLDPISGLVSAVKADGMGINIATVDLRQGDEERTANARLISAAPDLIEIAYMVTMLRRLGGMLPGVRELLDTLVKDADAAIAKVTGSAAC